MVSCTAVSPAFPVFYSCLAPGRNTGRNARDVKGLTAGLVPSHILVNKPPFDNRGKAANMGFAGALPSDPRR